MTRTVESQSRREKMANAALAIERIAGTDLDRQKFFNEFLLQGASHKRREKRTQRHRHPHPVSVQGIGPKMVSSPDAGAPRATDAVRTHQRRGLLGPRLAGQPGSR